MNFRQSRLLPQQNNDNDFPHVENNKDDIAGLEKWFNDNFSKINDKQDNILSFVQGKIKKIKAEAHEKNVKIDDPNINQAVLNYTIQDYGKNFFFWSFLEFEIGFIKLQSRIMSLMEHH